MFFFFLKARVWGYAYSYRGFIGIDFGCAAFLECRACLLRFSLFRCEMFSPDFSNSCLLFFGVQVGEMLP